MHWQKFINDQCVQNNDIDNQRQIFKRAVNKKKQLLIIEMLRTETTKKTITGHVAQLI